MKCFDRHLHEDGLILVEPWIISEAWNVGIVHMLTDESENMKICRMNVSEQDGSLSSLDFHYLIGTCNGVQHYTEHHELGLFSVEEMYRAFGDVDLQAEYNEQGISERGLYIAKFM